LNFDASQHAKEVLRAEMSERTRLSAVRAEIGMALARQDTLRGMLHTCAEAMVRHLDAAFARIWTLNSDGQELELQASAGMYGRLDGRYRRIPLGQFKIGLIAQEGRAHLTNDVYRRSFDQIPRAIIPRTSLHCGCFRTSARHQRPHGRVCVAWRHRATSGLLREPGPSTSSLFFTSSIEGPWQQQQYRIIDKASHGVATWRKGLSSDDVSLILVYVR